MLPTSGSRGVCCCTLDFVATRQKLSLTHLEKSTKSITVSVHAKIVKLKVFKHSRGLSPYNLLSINRGLIPHVLEQFSSG